jgi:hypothetical protein
MILDNENLYAIVQRLSAELREAGEEEWSSALNDAMTISTAPGEVLGEIRLQLQALRASKISAYSSWKDRIDEALSYLDSVLG